MSDPRVRQRVNPLTERLDAIARINADAGFAGGGAPPPASGGMVLPPAPRPLDDPGGDGYDPAAEAAFAEQWGHAPGEKSPPAPVLPVQAPAPRTFRVMPNTADLGVPTMLDMVGWRILTSTGQSYSIPEQEREQFTKYAYDRVVSSAVEAFNEQLVKMREALGIKLPVPKEEKGGQSADQGVRPVPAAEAGAGVGSERVAGEAQPAVPPVPVGVDGNVAAVPQGAADSPQA